MARLVIITAVALAIFSHGGAAADAQQPMLGYTPHDSGNSASATQTTDTAVTVDHAPAAVPTSTPAVPSSAKPEPAALSPVATHKPEEPQRRPPASPEFASIPASATPDNGAAKTTSPGGTANPFNGMALSNHGPIDIHSDSLAMDYKGNTVWFKGNVHATQGDTTLTSDTLSVLYGNNMREIHQIVALGNVKVSQGQRWATGQKAVMDQVARTIEMTGDPVIHDGRDQVKGKRILIYLDSQKTQIDGASAEIYPHDSDSRNNNPVNDSPTPRGS